MVLMIYKQYSRETKDLSYIIDAGFESRRNLLIIVYKEIMSIYYKSPI